MEARNLVYLAGGLVFAFGLGIMASNPGILTTVSPEGAVGQPILLYGAAIVLIVGAGFFLKRLRIEQNKAFSLRGFLNVSISGLLIGGILHEFTHTVLLQHATQFRIHFGDPTAIFSTCCLVQGEYAYEEIAYLVQLIVMVAWIYFNRNFFIRENEKTNEQKIPTPVPIKKTGKMLMKTPAKAVEKTPIVQKEILSEKKPIDFDNDPEWDSIKREMESALNGKRRSAGKKKTIPRRKKK